MNKIVPKIDPEVLMCGPEQFFPNFSFMNLSMPGSSNILVTSFFVFWLCKTTKIIFYFCLLTHFARQDRQNGNLKNKQNHVTKVTKIRKNEVTKMTWDKQKTYNFLGPTELQTFRLEYGLTTSEFRAAKVAKDWSLPIFWDSICSYKKQPVKEKFGIEYWTLPGSNSPWRS